MEFTVFEIILGLVVAYVGWGAFLKFKKYRDKKDKYTLIRG